MGYSVMSRRAARRAETIALALDVAISIMTESGAGGLTLSEMARRMGMRQPSLYKYFASLHAVYDALFARGVTHSGEAALAAAEAAPPGLARIRAAGTAIVRWAVENPALAQLLFWRPVPGFAPTAETFALSRAQMALLASWFAEAVRRGELSPAADVGLYTVVLSGLISQQLANEPGVSFADGAFTRLTAEALDMYFARYPGGFHADTRH
jgi:AcrR family transcriptional regulator